MTPDKHKRPLPSSTSRFLPEQPKTTTQWKIALRRIKVLYLGGHWQQCSARCDQLLRNENATVSLDASSHPTSTDHPPARPPPRNLHPLLLRPLLRSPRASHLRPISRKDPYPYRSTSILPSRRSDPPSPFLPRLPPLLLPLRPRIRLHKHILCLRRIRHPRLLQILH